MAQLAVSSASPLYQQLLEDIKSDINAKKYQTGSKIPSEPELSSIYNVSRITVRRAISELCNEGYLVKRQGKGTFVTPPKIHRKIAQDSHVLSFTATCAMCSFRAGAELLHIERCPSRQDEQSFLDIPADSSVIYVQRVRTADGQPVLLENNFLPSPEFDGLLQEDLDDCSLFDILRQKYGRSPVNRKKTTVEASRASQELARLLHIEPGDALFYITSYFVDDSDRPICIGKQYFVASRFVFYF